MSINSHNGLMPRRTFLRGLGVALALPWLEAMSPSSRSVINADGIPKKEIPRRAMFTYWELCAEPTGFTPADTGKNYTLTPSLAPLAPFKDDCTLMTDLSSYTGGHGSKTDTPVANVWQTMVNKVGMPLPENFQGGLAKEVVKELG